MSRAILVQRRAGHVLATAAALGLRLIVAVPRAQQPPPAGTAKPQTAPQGRRRQPAAPSRSLRIRRPRRPRRRSRSCRWWPARS